jgi:NADPH:quinone reductase-like Zn-dependent oxidoreductase
MMIPPSYFYAHQSYQGVNVKAAVIMQKDQPPIYGDFKEPMSAPDHSIVYVQASSISQITKARASATHYSSDNKVPFVPGFDGVGTLEDGSRVYFLLPISPFGAMAEFCLADKKHYIQIPQTLDAEMVAAMAIPGMSSWAALVEQAQMIAGETVFINGAGGISGRLAIQIAKYLGAKTIIATARKSSLFDELFELGADQCLLLTDDSQTMEDTFKSVCKQGVNIVLDYLWGPSALTLVNAIAKNSPQEIPVRYVQIGSIGGATIPFPASVLRSSGLRLMGSGLGSLSIQTMLDSVSQVLINTPAAGLKINIQQIPLAQVQTAWNMTSSDSRTVLMI